MSLLNTLQRAAAKDRHTAKRPHVIAVSGRMASGEMREIKLDRSKYPAAKLREIAKAQLARAKASEAQ